jgi:hypothetical protein
LLAKRANATGMGEADACTGPAAWCAVLRRANEMHERDMVDPPCSHLSLVFKLCFNADAPVEHT